MFQDIYNRIGFNILKNRRINGWSQEHLAEESGILRFRISQYVFSKKIVYDIVSLAGNNVRL